MPYEIPDTFGLMVVSIRNSVQTNADSIRFGLDLTAAGLDQTEMNSASNIIRDDLRTLHDNSWTYGPCVLYERIGGTLFKLENPDEEVGSAAAIDYSSPQVSAIVKKSSAQVGPRHRGRMYHPGVPESAVDEQGLLTLAYRTAVTTAYELMRADLIALPNIDGMVILHEQGTPGASVPTQVSNLACQPIVGTQRLRVRR